ncbi:tripartite tricarboxylate transporter substrate binding protein [Pigmentiphaga soli]|uniref:Tripartite tricarboxylate transporter substrate binding protein n=1 Tax=Pigmentiphaga soli TaxID=1007095 RepID=A0ABP8GBH7_9BURK
MFRHLLRLLLLCVPLTAFAQAPTAPVRLIIPFAPGGTADILGRLLANSLTPIVGQQVIVENRSGASGFIAAQATAAAKPDGQTLMMSFLNLHAVSKQVPGMNLPIDPDKDLTPIVNVARVPFILVANKNAPFNTVQELIAYARANPDKLSFASSGSAGGPHLAGELFKAQAGVSILHVPYRGGAPAVNDIIAGNTTMIFGLLPELIGQIQAKNLKPIAMLSQNPNPLVPNVPLIRSVLPNYDNDYWYAISGPAGMAPATVAYWNEAVNKALQTPELRQRLERQALEPIGGSVESFRATIKSDYDKWGDIVRRAHITAE